MGLIDLLKRCVRRLSPSPRPNAVRPRTAPGVETLEDRRVPSSGELTRAEVDLLLRRAAAASASTDAIIAVVDRNGRPLGVRVEAGVSPGITSNTGLRVFAVDGALTKARTGAFFSSDEAPLTSRTVQFISQSTVTLREVNSNPNVQDVLSRARGPGFVAPVGLGGHFPPKVPNTPPVDLFGIEHTNRDSLLHPGRDHVKEGFNVGDDKRLKERFNIDPAFVPAGKSLYAPESYGFVSGLMPRAQARGIGTLPGGVPIFKNGHVVGGIGVFFPGALGFASAENSGLSDTFDPTKPDRSVEAEWIAFAAAGGSAGAGFPVEGLNGVAALSPMFDLPFGRIDLAGVTLDIYGPGGLRGPDNLVEKGLTYGLGAVTGENLPVTPDGRTLIVGLPVPDEWLVIPHDGVGITAEEVTRMITQGINEANLTRAQIRLPLGKRAKMVFAVADKRGEVVGLYRMPDATYFSVDVAVAKARNASYYADPTALLKIDQVPGLPPGVAPTARTFRYLAQPRYPEGIDGTAPGPFSILNDRGTRAIDFQSAYGFDSFNPGANFHNQRDPIKNQNGVVFFPGSSAVYVPRDGQVVLGGGLGVSGDGVDQDDVVTSGAIFGFDAPFPLRADAFFVRDVRLPYFKFPRNPRAT